MPIDSDIDYVNILSLRETYILTQTFFTNNPLVPSSNVRGPNHLKNLFKQEVNAIDDDNAIMVGLEVGGGDMLVLFLEVCDDFKGDEFTILKNAGF